MKFTIASLLISSTAASTAGGSYSYSYSMDDAGVAPPPEDMIRIYACDNVCKVTKFFTSPEWTCKSVEAIKGCLEAEPMCKKADGAIFPEYAWIPDQVQYYLDMECQPKPTLDDIKTCGTEIFDAVNDNCFPPYDEFYDVEYEEHDHAGDGATGANRRVLKLKNGKMAPRQLKGVPMGPKPPPGVEIEEPAGGSTGGKPPPPPPEAPTIKPPKEVWSLLYGSMDPIGADGNMGSINFFGSYSEAIEGSYSQIMDEIVSGSFDFGSYADSFDFGSTFEGGIDSYDYGDNVPGDGQGGQGGNSYLPDCMIADLTTQTMTCTYPGGEGATPTCDEAFAYMDCIESACPEGELEAMGQGYMWREKTLEDLQCIDAVEPWAPVTDGSCAINCYDAIMKADELCDYGQLVFTDEWGYEYRYEPFEMNYMFETIGCMFPTPAAAIATVEASFTLNMELPDETTSEFWMFYDILSTTLESFAGQGEEARVMKIGDVMVGWDDDHDGHDHRNLAAADVVVDYKIRIFKTCEGGTCSDDDKAASQSAVGNFAAALKTAAEDGSMDKKFEEVATEIVMMYGDWADPSFMSSVSVKEFPAVDAAEIVTMDMEAEEPPAPGTHTTLGSGPANVVKAGFSTLVAVGVAAFALI